MPTPPSTSDPINDVPLPDHVRLILVREPQFYLEIPINIISCVCLKPRKYLAFLGWCVLGVEGVLQGETGGPLELDSDGELDNKGVYYYATPEGTGLSQAVDLDAIKEESTLPSGTPHTLNDFDVHLLERDTCCVFTGMDDSIGVEGVHIIPYSKGSEWFQMIIRNRPKYEEEVEDLTDIDDIRNGFYAFGFIYRRFNEREVVVLKTPNPFLDTSDIPHSNRPFMLEMPEEASYPSNMRYTLQWVVKPSPPSLHFCPNNLDAAFKKDTQKPKPSDLLLHYNYGGAAIKWWGRGTEVLQGRPDLPRPIGPLPNPKRRPRTPVDDRAAAKEEGQWDEDDVMLFFWGNSPAAVERRRKAEEERTNTMEQWRQGVPSSSE